MVTIARCPEHGLHGERDTCYICGAEVEQVELVEMTWLGLLAILDAWYPAEVFTSSAEDVGARLVVLARKHAAAEMALERACQVAASNREAAEAFARTLEAVAGNDYQHGPGGRVARIGAVLTAYPGFLDD